MKNCMYGSSGDWAEKKNVDENELFASLTILLYTEVQALLNDGLNSGPTKTFFKNLNVAFSQTAFCPGTL